MAVKRVAVSKRETLTEDQVDNLLSGWNLGPEAFKDEQERKRAWFAHRDPLMGYIGKTRGRGFTANTGYPGAHVHTVGGATNRLGHEGGSGPTAARIHWGTG